MKKIYLYTEMQSALYDVDRLLERNNEPQEALNLLKAKIYNLMQLLKVSYSQVHECEEKKRHKQHDRQIKTFNEMSSDLYEEEVY
jgi:hypothetical protein